jgi:hypothetical protein
MNHYKDLDTLYDFLKGIATIEEFFARKEPCFNDNVMREFAQWSLDNGSDPDSVLGGLKANERQKFAESRKERSNPH